MPNNALFCWTVYCLAYFKFHLGNVDKTFPYGRIFLIVTFDLN